MNELISCREAAEMLEIPPRTFTGWMADGTINPDCIFRLEGKRPRIRKAVFVRIFSLGIESATAATAATAAQNGDIYARLHDQ